ncbi:MAG: hypothetical protein J2O48_03365 [Solirubrobacterales bacterium]|nr:hypothetical protein [Solirubrobacterales bacterium]
MAVIALAQGFAASWPLRLAEVLALVGCGAGAIVGVVALVVLRLGGWRESDAEFDRLVDHSEELALTGEEQLPAEVEDGPVSFDAVLAEVVRGLGLELHQALEYVELVVADSGSAAARGGHRIGRYAVRQHHSAVFNEQIVLLADRLMHDFGDDDVQLASQLRALLEKALGGALTGHPRHGR